MAKANTRASTTTAPTTTSNKTTTTRRPASPKTTSASWSPRPLTSIPSSMLAISRSRRWRGQRTSSASSGFVSGRITWDTTTCFRMMTPRARRKLERRGLGLPIQTLFQAPNSTSSSPKKNSLNTRISTKSSMRSYPSMKISSPSLLSCGTDSTLPTGQESRSDDQSGS